MADRPEDGSDAVSGEPAAPDESALTRAATEGLHLTWPDSEEPGRDEPPRRRGQPVVSGSPGLGVVTFGLAPRPFDLPDEPDDS